MKLKRKREGMEQLVKAVIALTIIGIFFIIILKCASEVRIG